MRSSKFFTSRGLAVATVDYRGSSGHGRAYRQSLHGLWGEADVDDCVHYALGLGRAGVVDEHRMAIRGTSAGGLTALGALVRADCFAGAASWYGVTDLEALVADTHDFESRYVDSLVGPWPEAAETYRARSPIHRPEGISGRVLLLQGADDPVVPADQSERFAARLAEHGVPCRLILFEGESHGFRRAETIEAALLAELDFYRSLFAPVRGPVGRVGPGERPDGPGRALPDRPGQTKPRWYPRPCPIRCAEVTGHGPPDPVGPTWGRWPGEPTSPSGPSRRNGGMPSSTGSRPASPWAQVSSSGSRSTANGARWRPGPTHWPACS